MKLKTTLSTLALSAVLAAQIALPVHSIRDLFAQKRAGLPLKFAICQISSVRENEISVDVYMPSVKYGEKIPKAEKALADSRGKNADPVYFYTPLSCALYADTDGFAKMDAYGASAQKAPFKAKLNTDRLDPEKRVVHFDDVYKTFHAAQKTLEKFKPQMRAVGNRKPAEKLNDRKTYAVLVLTKKGKFIIDDVVIDGISISTYDTTIK